MSGLSEAQERGGWVLMQVDWKACGDVEWQAREMAALQGIGVPDDRKICGSAPETVLAALRHFDRWLQAHDRRFVFLDLDADAYYGFAIACADEAAAASLANEADVTLVSTPLFLRSQGERE